MNALLGQFPYHISFQVSGGDFCSGCLIDEKFAISAAHCIVDEHNITWRRQLQILVGVVDLDSNYTSRNIIKVEKVFIPAKFFMHPKSNLDDYGDLAVLKVSNILLLFF